MSKTMKWIIVLGILVIILVLLTTSSVFNTTYTPGTTSSQSLLTPTGSRTSSPTTKPPASIGGVKSTNQDLDQINRDLARADMLMRTAESGLASLNSSSMPSSVLSAASNFQAVIPAFASLQVELQAAMANRKVMSLKSTIADMGNQMSNASSALGVVANNVKGINQNTTVAANNTLQQALIEIKISETYLKVARNDISSVISAL